MTHCWGFILDRGNRAVLYIHHEKQKIRVILTPSVLRSGSYGVSNVHAIM